MEVYLLTQDDWANFVNGAIVVALRNPTDEYYKKILVSPIEIVEIKSETVSIFKKY